MYNYGLVVLDCHRWVRIRQSQVDAGAWFATITGGCMWVVLVLDYRKCITAVVLLQMGSVLDYRVRHYNITIKSKVTSPSNKQT